MIKMWLMVMEKIIKTLFPLSIALFIIGIIGNVNGEQPLKVYREPGETITLHCPLTLTAELYKLYWKKDGIQILSLWSGRDPSPTEDKYGLAGNTSLTITDIDRSDAAIYTCTFYLMDGSFYKSDTIQLFVPELSVSHCPDTDDFGNNGGGCDCHINGNSVSDLTCTALGFPQEPSLSWKLGDQLRLESSIIYLKNYSNNMTLVCLAEDPVLRDHPLSDKRVCVYYQTEIHTDQPDQDIEPYEQPWFVGLLAVIFCLFILLIIFIMMKRKSHTEGLKRMIRRESEPMIEVQSTQDCEKGILA